jgi:hypothetical protein
MGTHYFYALNTRNISPCLRYPLIDLIKSLVDDIDSMLNYYKISDIKDLTKKQASEIIKRKQS